MIVQRECYQKDDMLRAYEKQNFDLNAQLCDMSRYIKTLEQKNWNLNEKVRGMEPERTIMGQASSFQWKGCQG
jgi:hypothetical protein